MTTTPVLAIGSDCNWRARVDRILSGRRELSWLGARGASERRHAREQPWLLMVDGDDPRVGCELRSWCGPLPQLLYFYRIPTVWSLQTCVHAGASGCLQKEANQETVLRAIRSVSAGLFAVAPTLLLRTLMDSWGAAPAPMQAAAPLEVLCASVELTERQREVVRWAAQGLSNKQIARILGISPETVKTHLHHAFARAGVNGRMALLAVQWDASPAAIAENPVDAADPSALLGRRSRHGAPNGCRPAGASAA